MLCAHLKKLSLNQIRTFCVAFSQIDFANLLGAPLAHFSHDRHITSLVLAVNHSLNFHVFRHFFQCRPYATACLLLLLNFCSVLDAAIENQADAPYFMRFSLQSKTTAISCCCPLVLIISALVVCLHIK